MTGYWRDAGRILFVSKAGVCYVVTEPGRDDPVWRELVGTVEDCLSPEAEPARLDDKDMATFERSRVAFGVHR